MSSTHESDNALRSIVREIVTEANQARTRYRNKLLKIQDGLPDDGPKVVPVESQPRPQSNENKDATGGKSKPNIDRLMQSPPYRITETLAAFVVRAVIMDPQYNFDISQQLNRNEVDRLIQVIFISLLVCVDVVFKICVDKIIQNQDQVYETIKMQVYFDTNFPVQNEFLRAEKQNRLQSALNVLQAIHDTKTRSVPALEGMFCLNVFVSIILFVALYRKVVSYVLLLGNNGSPTDLTVVRETTGTCPLIFFSSIIGCSCTGICLSGIGTSGIHEYDQE